MEKCAAYPDDFLDLTREMLSGETKGYYDWVAKLHTISTGHFTDKMPFNFVHIWLIRALLPEAAIIHCHKTSTRRDHLELLPVIWFGD